MAHHPAADATEKSVFGSLSPEEFYDRHSVSHSTHRFPSSSLQGVTLFAQSWAPLPPSPTLATVALLHGFRDSSSSFLLTTAVLFARSGFATCALDYPGHGLSSGLPAHLPDLRPVLQDCAAFFRAFRSRHAPPSLPSFLYGESLGGAIALLLALDHPPWDGVVLSGAMCGIGAQFRPPWPLRQLLRLAAGVIPSWPVAFTRAGLAENSLKVGWKRRLSVSGMNYRWQWQRAATALELLRVSEELQGRFADVDVPLLIVHGGDDAVCDPTCVEALHRVAPSKDKTIRIYPGMWHMLIGEEDDSVELVFGGIVEWLQARAKSGPQNGAA